MYSNTSTLAVMGYYLVPCYSAVIMYLSNTANSSEQTIVLIDRAVIYTACL